jgi:hypothetical protein
MKPRTPWALLGAFTAMKPRVIELDDLVEEDVPAGPLDADNRREPLICPRNGVR